MQKKSGSKYRVSASGFPRNRYVALEESRKLLGLTADEFNALLKILCKSEFSSLDFDFGALSISFNTRALYGDEEVCLTFQLERKRFTRSVGYKFRPSDFGLFEKQLRLEDLGEE